MSHENQHNLVIRFEGTKDEYKRLLTYFQSGELEKLLHLPIQHVRLVPARPEATSVVTRSNEIVPQVLQRVYNSLESGWQAVESLLDIEQQKLAHGWRSAEQLQAKDMEIPKASMAIPAEGFMRGIDLDLLEIDQQVALIVALMPGNLPQEIDILVEVRPKQGQTTLPPNLQLMVIDYKGATVLSAQAAKADPRITFALTGNIGEPFSVKLALNDFSYMQEFPI